MIRRKKNMLEFKIHLFSEVGSTMLEARKLARETPAPFVVWALKQSTGYGRKGAFWASPEGGLWFTAVFLITRLSGLSSFLSLVVLSALQEEVAELKVKWPNDIIFGKRKVAGLLTEYRERVFWGVGVNLNNELPLELRERAVSLKELTGKEYDPEQVLRSILNRLSSLLSAFEERGFSQFISEYERNLAFFGKNIRVMQGEKILEGKAHGISDEGFLKLETTSGPLLLRDGTILDF
jgi:BirA family biotin operon repressor/biotin-[acetyl-CoA-carboxylase] ligase